MNSTSPYRHGLRQFKASALSLTFALLPLAQAMAKPTQAEVDKQAQANVVFDRTVLPIAPYQKVGKITPNINESDPIAWPIEISAPKGAPNVLLIMTDDVGFGATETFGGAIPTPTYDKLAKHGLKYNNFYTTALSSPSRAALITGRNHHVGSTGIIMELSTPYPGYHSLMSKGVGTIGEILTDNGYGTSWYGKTITYPTGKLPRLVPSNFGRLA